MSPNEQSRMQTLLSQGGVARCLSFYRQARLAYLKEAKSRALRSDRRRAMRQASRVCRGVLLALSKMTPAGDERQDYRVRAFVPGWHPHMAFEEQGL